MVGTMGCLRTRLGSCFVNVITGVVAVGAIYLLFVAGVQFWAIRKLLRHALQPYWDAYSDVLRAGADGFGPVQALVARVTMPLGRRLWPPVSGDSDDGSGPPPPHS